MNVQNFRYVYVVSLTGKAYLGSLKKSHEITKNYIKSSQSRLQSSIFNFHNEGLKIT